MGARVSLIHIEHLRYLYQYLRHDIVQKSKLWVHNQSMDVMYIFRPTIELQVLDHPGINPLDHGLSMFLIKLELYRGSPLSY